MPSPYLHTTPEGQQHNVYRFQLSRQNSERFREAQSQARRQKMETERRKHLPLVATAIIDHGPCSRQSGPFHLTTDVRTSLSK